MRVAWAMAFAGCVGVAGTAASCGSDAPGFAPGDDGGGDDSTAGSSSGSGSGSSGGGTSGSSSGGSGVCKLMGCATDSDCTGCGAILYCCDQTAHACYSPTTSYCPAAPDAGSTSSSGSGSSSSSGGGMDAGGAMTCMMPSDCANGQVCCVAGGGRNRGNTCTAPNACQGFVACGSNADCTGNQVCRMFGGGTGICGNPQPMMDATMPPQDSGTRDSSAGDSAPRDTGAPGDSGSPADTGPTDTGAASDVGGG